MLPASLPQIEPILPTLRPDVPRGREWRYEPKLDGFRGVLYIDGNRAWFRSKTSRLMPRFQSLADSVGRELRLRSAILDEEIVVLADDGRPDFRALMRGAAPMYSAFDVLWLDGRDLRSRPYGARKKRLHALLTPHPAIGFVPCYREPELFDAAVRLDLEGVVAKRNADPYDARTEWVKVKHRGYSQNVGRPDLFVGAEQR